VPLLPIPTLHFKSLVAEMAA